MVNWQRTFQPYGCLSEAKAAYHWSGLGIPLLPDEPVNALPDRVQNLLRADTEGRSYDFSNRLVV